LQTDFYDTGTRPLMQRGDFWLDEVCARHLGVSGRTYVNSDPFFYGRASRVADTGYTVTQLCCSAGTASRRAEQVRKVTHNAVVVFIQRGRGVQWRQRGREVTLRTGDMMVSNPDEPYELATEGDFDLVSVFLPRSVLAAHMFPGDPDQPQVLSRDSPTSALAARFGMDLATNLAKLPPADAHAMIDALARLVAVAGGAAAPMHGGAVRQARLDQAHAYIDANLGDPALSPAACAKAIGMSLRALHLAFEPSGESFSQYLQRRRLERCHVLLLSPAAAGRPVSDIAYACGFGSLAGFYRAFSRAFGASPSDVRAEGKKGVLF
jgi:AraC-like DNA-binding protein